MIIRGHYLFVDKINIMSPDYLTYLSSENE